VGVKGYLRTVAVRVAWIAVALLIALGGAGIVATMGHVPGTVAREELTWAGDAAVEPVVDAATVQLGALADEVDQLATTARRALSQMAAGDTPALTDTIDEGTTRLASVQQRANELEASLSAVPYTGDDWALHISAGVRERYQQLAGTSGLTEGLEANWTAFTDRALDASHLATLLTSHDQETAAAAKLGSAGKYKAALAALDPSDATIAEARDIRDRLAKSTDVATLTDWLDRNAAYDVALRTLYGSLVASNGHVTADVTKAFEGEQKARADLPGDTRGLVVIMSDIAQGGLNQAVISIEEARGSLAQALEVQQQLRDAGKIQPPE